MIKRAARAALVCLAVPALAAALTGCTPPTAQERVAAATTWTDIAPARDVDAVAMAARAEEAFSGVGWRMQIGIGEVGNVVDVRRYIDGVEVEMDGWRLGKAAQIRVGSPDSPQVALAWDDGAREVCQDVSCTPLERGEDRSETARIYDGLDVVLAVAPVTPEWSRTVRNRLKIPGMGDLYSGRMQTPAGPASCLAWVRGESVEPVGCVLTEGWSAGIPVPVGYARDGALNTYLVSLTKEMTVKLDG